MSLSLTAQQIDFLFGKLNQELARTSVRGEVFVVGGAVMCLALNVRTATKDVDALFRPAAEVRKAAETVAIQSGFDVPLDWLNDAVKGFLSPRGSFRDYREMSNLRVMTAEPEYLLAMKCMSMRIGEESHDVDDTCFLLDHLGIGSYDEALSVVAKYYPVEQIPQKTFYALEEITASSKDTESTSR